MRKYPFVGKKLMAPGPVPMPEAVRNSFTELECHHRTKEFGEILQRVFQNLKQVFQTEQHCFMLASTGTGGLEAAMVNTAQKDKKSLFINAGKFGERWGKIAKAYGLGFDELMFEWGRDIDLNKVEDSLKKNDYQLLAFQACETSTGAFLPVQELAALANKYSCLSVVDGITALGAAKLPMDEWGLDVVIGGSQKAFMLPTGMAFVSLSEKAQAHESDINKYYFDLKAERKANLSGKTRYSTPTQFVIGLDIVLDEMINQIGFEKHLQQVSDKAKLFRDLVNLEMFPQTPSPSLTCLKIPEGQSGNKIKDEVGEKGFIIVGGQDQLSDKVIRVGHMGSMTEDDLRQTAQAINSSL